MATSTGRLALRQPAPTDLVSVVTDVNDSMAKIDASVGYEVITAFPPAPYAGKPVTFSNDSYRSYFHNGTTPVSGGWVEIVNSSGTFGADINLASSKKLIIGADTNLYRSAANTLKTDDNLIVAGTSTLTGAVTVVGDLKLVNGATTYRPKLSTPTTVANTTTETYLASMTIPANDAVVGAVYRLEAWGLFSVTGTPTLNFKNKLGGVGGVGTGATGAQTIQSGVTNRLWTAKLLLVCESTGASASWNSFVKVKMAGVLAGAAPYINDAAEITTVIDGTNSAVQDSTVSNVFGITATWSAASASNTITCKGFIAERVA